MTGGQDRETKVWHEDNYDSGRSDIISLIFGIVPFWAFTKILRTKLETKKVNLINTFTHG